MLRTAAVLASMCLLSAACAPRWRAGPLVDARDVARALGDPVDLPADTFDPRAVPKLDPPQKVRPCCAFGQDLKARLGPVPVPLYENENVLAPDDIGPHAYDKSGLARERNGLVYTCRGGFIDVAHIRDNADRTLYLALEIVRALPGGVTIDLPEEGTARRVIVRPLTPAQISRHGRWGAAVALASWTNYQLSIWHEIVTWYGWSSTPGFPERLSAFSPEDLYSNVLGTNLAAGVVLNRDIRSREEYDLAMTAWIREGLRRLGAVPRVKARQAMQAVEGLWWDSSKRLPDMRLISRRDLDIDRTSTPWLVGDVVDAPATRDICAGQPPPLALKIAGELGDVAIADLVTIELRFTRWTPKTFPRPAREGDVVTAADFPEIVEDVRRQGARELGPGFDRPGARTAKQQSEPQSEPPAEPGT